MFARIISRNKITVRTLLALIAIVAVVCAVAPQIYHRVTWKSQHSQLVEWSAKLKRRPHTNEVLTVTSPSGHSLSVSTNEPQLNNYPVEIIYEAKEPGPKRFYVTPPGKWVNTIDEVFAEWIKYDQLYSNVNHR